MSYPGRLFSFQLYNDSRNTISKPVLFIQQAQESKWVHDLCEFFLINEGKGKYFQLQHDKLNMCMHLLVGLVALQTASDQLWRMSCLGLRETASVKMSTVEWQIVNVAREGSRKVVLFGLIPQQPSHTVKLGLYVHGLVRTRGYYVLSVELGNRQSDFFALSFFWIKRTCLERTFFHFPWGYVITEFHCTCQPLASVFLTSGLDFP